MPATKSGPMGLSAEANTLVGEIKALIDKRTSIATKSKKTFAEIKTKVDKLHTMCPALTNFQIGELLGQKETWVRRCLGAKTEAAKAFTRIVGQLRTARDSMKDQKIDIGLLTSMRVELTAMVQVVDAAIAAAAPAKTTKKAA